MTVYGMRETQSAEVMEWRRDAWTDGKKVRK